MHEMDRMFPGYGFRGAQRLFHTAAFAAIVAAWALRHSPQKFFTFAALRLRFRRISIFSPPRLMRQRRMLSRHRHTQSKFVRS